MSMPKPPCVRCNGTGYGIAEDYIEPPTYWELVNCDPRPCSQCLGTGAEDPDEGGDWWVRRP